MKVSMLDAWKYIQSKYFEKSTDPIAQRFVKPNIKVWECNLKTGEVKEAQMVKILRYNYFVGELTTNEVVINKNCLYDLAINGLNATRKFEKRIVKLTSKK